MAPANGAWIAQADPGACCDEAASGKPGAANG